MQLRKKPGFVTPTQIQPLSTRLWTARAGKQTPRRPPPLSSPCQWGQTQLWGFGQWHQRSKAKALVGFDTKVTVIWLLESWSHLTAVTQTAAQVQESCWLQVSLYIFECLQSPFHHPTDKRKKRKLEHVVDSQLSLCRTCGTRKSGLCEHTHSHEARWKAQTISHSKYSQQKKQNQKQTQDEGEQFVKRKLTSDLKLNNNSD